MRHIDIVWADYSGVLTLASLVISPSLPCNINSVIFLSVVENSLLELPSTNRDIGN